MMIFLTESILAKNIGWISVKGIKSNVVDWNYVLVFFFFFFFYVLVLFPPSVVINVGKINHNRPRQANKPIRSRGQYVQPGQSAGKRDRQVNSGFASWIG